MNPWDEGFRPILWMADHPDGVLVCISIVFTMAVFYYLLYGGWQDPRDPFR